MLKTATGTCVLMVCLAVTAVGQGGKFVPLFDGKTLNGWEVCNGFAKYGCASWK